MVGYGCGVSGGEGRSGRGRWVVRMRVVWLVLARASDDDDDGTGGCEGRETRRCVSSLSLSSFEGLLDSILGLFSPTCRSPTPDLNPSHTLCNPRTNALNQITSCLRPLAGDEDVPPDASRRVQTTSRSTHSPRLFPLPHPSIPFTSR